jgi:hypothetical protein
MSVHSQWFGSLGGGLGNNKADVYASAGQKVGVVIQGQGINKQLVADVQLLANGG